MPAVQLETQKVDYEGFEIHVSAAPVQEGGTRYTYTAYVCHPGADISRPGHAVQYHPDGDETFRSEHEAVEEAAQVGRSIIEGTHPDLSVLSLVTQGY